MLSDIISYLFKENGIVQNVVGSYRSIQEEYAVAIARSLENTDPVKRFSVYNATGGIGKTMGYLLPAVINFIYTGRKSAVATTTISLRDDILAKEYDKIEQIISAINNDPILLNMLNKQSVSMPVIHCRRSKAQYISDDWLKENSDKTDYKIFVDFFKNNTLIDDWIEAHDSLPVGLTRDIVSLRPGERGRSYKDYNKQKKEAATADIILVTQAFLLYDGISYNPVNKDRERDLIVDEVENIVAVASMVQSNFVLSDWNSVLGGKDGAAIQSHVSAIRQIADQTLANCDFYTIYEEYAPDKNRAIRDSLVNHLSAIKTILEDKDRNSSNVLAQSIGGVIKSLLAKHLHTKSQVSFIRDTDPDTGNVEIRLRNWFPYDNTVLPFIYRNFRNVILTSAHIIAPGEDIRQVKRQYGLFDDSVLHVNEFYPDFYGYAGVIWNGEDYIVTEKVKEGKYNTTDYHIKYCATQAVFAANHGQAVMLVPSYRDMDRIHQEVIKLDPKLTVYRQSTTVKPTDFIQHFGQGDKFLILLISWEGVNYPGIDHLLISRIPRAPIDEERQALGKKADINVQRDEGFVNAKRKLSQGLARGIRDASHAVVFHMCDPRLVPENFNWLGKTLGQYHPCFPERFPVEFAAVSNHSSLMCRNGVYLDGPNNEVDPKVFFSNTQMKKCFT